MKVGYLHRGRRETREEVEQQVQRLKDAACERVIVMENDISPKGDFPLEPIKDFFQAGDTLVTIRLSRLCFSFNQLVHFCEWLKSNNITLQTLDEDIYGGDSSLPDFYYFLERLAIFQKDIRRESTLIGLAAARARGRLGGRPKGLSEKHIKKQTLQFDSTTNVKCLLLKFASTSPFLKQRFIAI